MKEYCVDLEIAKELKENGFPQETYFYHTPGRFQYGWDGDYELYDDGSWSIVNYNPIEYNNWLKDKDAMKTDNDYFITEEREKELKSQVCSAPTSDEMLKELPKTISHFGCLTIMEGMEYNWTVCYLSNGEYTHKSINENDNKLSNALAKMWLSLKKKGYIREEINENKS